MELTMNNIKSIKTNFTYANEGSITITTQNGEEIEIPTYVATNIGRCAKAIYEYQYLCEYFGVGEQEKYKQASYQIVDRINDNDGLTTDINTIENDIIKDLQEEGTL